MTSLRDRLADLADSAAPASGAPASELWHRGRRRARQRRVAAVGGVLAVAVVVAGVAGLVVRPPERGEPATAPAGRAVLPDRFWEPSGWLPVADGPTGSLISVIPAAHRTWTASSSGLVGVSAVTQQYAFLDLPGLVLDGFGDASALSPDGRYVAYWYGTRQRPDLAAEPADGVAVLDTASGEITRHALTSDLGVQLGPLSWGGGTLWFQQLDYTENREGTSSARLAASWEWDVSRGDPRRVDDPRGLLGSVVGTTPGGLVAAKGERLFLVADGGDLTAGPVATSDARRSVVSAALSPDGRRLALTMESATSNRTRIDLVDLGQSGVTTVEASKDDLGAYPQVEGWRDDDRLVVERLVTGRRSLAEVDTATNQVEELAALTTYNPQQQWASGLLASPVAAAVAPDEPHDPRKVAALTGGAVLLVLGAGLVAWRRRRARS